MNKENQRKKSDQIPFRIEKGRNYYLFNSEYFFNDFSSNEIEILERILKVQKIEPFQLKDLTDCEGILKNNPLIPE